MNKGLPIKIVKFFLYSALAVVLPALLIFYGGAFLFGSRQITNSCRGDSLQLKERPQFAPTMLANGLAFGDYGNDGWDDLFVASSPGYSTIQPSKIYKNIRGEFSDVTRELNFPDLMASSGYFADYDNDGWLDLFVVELFSTESMPHRRLARIRAFRNLKGKTFQEKTSELGFDKIKAETGDAAFLTFADFNSDGLLDVVASFNGAYQRYQGAFKLSSDILKKGNGLGIDTFQMVCGDRNVRRVLENEPELKKTIEKDYGQTYFLERRGCLNVSRSIAPGSTPPLLTLKSDDLIAVHAVLPGELYVFQNTGSHFEANKIFDSLLGYPDGNEKISSGQTLWPFLSHKFYQPVTLDFNKDGLMDIFTAADWGRNVLLENRGNFQFKDVSLQKGLDVFGTGMGVALGDPQRRGTLDLIVTNMGRAFWFHNENGKFLLDANQTLNRSGFGWGAAFFDADNDGWTDIYFANGTRNSTNPELEKQYSRSTAFYQNDYRRDAFYRNINGVFYDYSNKDICADTTNTYPVAVADINHDGYDDLAVGTAHPLDKKSVTIFENQGGGNHHLQIRLRGKKSNRFGVGATITVQTSDGSKQTQLVAIGEGFASQNSLTKTFGLGRPSNPVNVAVIWPSGIVQVLHHVLPNSAITVEEEQTPYR